MKIPDDVFESRCQYCIHKIDGIENKDIPESWYFQPCHEKDRPCRLLGIAKYHEIPGECLNFSPRFIFGICLTCAYENAFCDGYCTSKKQPNKHQVYTGNKTLANSHRLGYWEEHILSTCDEYRPKPNYLDLMIEDAASGRAPRNFDPDTMRPIGADTQDKINKRWAEIEREIHAAKALIEMEKRKSAAGPAGEQLMIGE